MMASTEQLIESLWEDTPLTEEQATEILVYIGDNPKLFRKIINGCVCFNPKATYFNRLKILLSYGDL